MMFEPHTIKDVAALLLGEPNAALTTGKQLRYGTHGSLAIDLKKNTFSTTNPTKAAVFST